MLIYIYTTLIILYLIAQFTIGTMLNFAIGIVALIALINSFFYAKGSYRISGIIFLISAIVLFLFNKLPWYEFLLHFKPMLGLLSLFLVLPFVSTLLRVGHYDKNLSTLLHDKTSDLNGLYKRSFIVCFILGLFLNVATLPLLMTALNGKLKHFSDDIKNKFFSQNLLRAFFLCITWSPMEVMVSMSLDLTKVKYYSILPVLVLMVIAAIGIDWKLSSFKFKKLNLSTYPSKEIEYSKIFKKTIQLAVMLIILIVSISSIQHFLNKGFLLSVVLVLIPFSIAWTMLIGKAKRYWTIVIPHWKERTKGLANYFFMFLSAGFFIEMVSVSGLLNILQPMFTNASESPLGLYLIIAGYFLLTSLIGFHPIISFTFLAGLLQPILPNVNPIPLTIVLISSSLVPTMFSPYNVTVSILADQLKVNPYRIGLWNFPFVIFYLAFCILAAYFLGIMLG